MSKKKPEEDLAEVAGFAVGGAAAGAGVSTFLGGMGLAVAGTAFSIGMAPVVGAGAVVGLAAYGVKKAIESVNKD